MSGQPYFALEYRYIVINIAFVILYVIINQWYSFLNFVLIIKVKNKKRDVHNVSLRSTKGLILFYFCSFIMGSCDLGLDTVSMSIWIVQIKASYIEVKSWHMSYSLQV